MIPKLRKTRKILTINFGGIGDEILFLPTLKRLRGLYPDSHITLMLEPRSASAVQVTDLVDDVITFDIKKRPLFISDLIDVVGLIKAGNYELVLSSGSSPAVSVLLFLGGTEWRVGYDSGAVGRALLTHAVPLNRNQYAGNMYYDLADYLENEDVGKAPVCIPEVVTKADSLERMQEFLDATVGDAKGRKKVLLHPGTSRLAIEKGIIKTWPVADWIGLIKLMQSRSDMVPILAGGPDDKEIIAEIERGMPLGTVLVSSAGQTKSLADLAALTKLCDLLVCVDSAPMHVAVGLGTPVVAMFAVTDENKLLPNDPKFKAIRSGSAVGAQTDTAPAKSPQDAGGPSQGSGSARGVVLSPDQVLKAALEQLQLS